MTNFSILLCGIFYLSLLLQNTLTESNDSCKQINSCKCEYANGTGIDLTPLRTIMLVTNRIYNEEGHESQYIFHPCTNSSKLPDINVDDKDNNACTSGFSVCILLLMKIKPID